MTLRHASELSTASQPFIDAVFANNGEPPPREAQLTPSDGPDPAPAGAAIALLREALSRLDPDANYDKWLRIGAAVFTESAGSQAGFELFDAWSSKGTKYRGPSETRRKWQSFRLDHPRPTTLATLRWMLRADGHDWAEVCACAEPFEVVDGEDA